MIRTVFHKYVPDRVRHMANMLIVSWLLVSPSIFVNISVLQDLNTSCYVIGVEEQNERQPGKEVHSGKSKMFLSSHLNNQILQEKIKSEMFVQSEILLNSRFMDDVPTQPPRLVRA